ncbi:alpha/beta fold hydrolase [Streptomyces filipinensis]|nr:alpha/beta fold hydrolase [Streptomyces filipinensis]
MSTQIPPVEWLPGYPGVEQWHRVPSTGQHYLDTGTGSPVLLLHGNPSWSYQWRHLLASLSPEFRCVAPDLPGLGLSPRPPEPARPADRHQIQLAYLDALFDHLVGDRGMPDAGWTLILHDWGGPLGLALARRRPGLLARLAVLNTIGFRWPPGYRLPLYLRWIRDHRTIAALAHTTNLFPRAAVRAGVVQPLQRSERRAYLLPSARRRDRRAVVEFVRSIPRNDDEDAWRLLESANGEDHLADVPLFVGWGMRDPVFTPLVLGEWRRRFPHARIHRYADAGHYVMEDAADRLGHDIRDFLLASERG